MVTISNPHTHLRQSQGLVQANADPEGEGDGEGCGDTKQQEHKWSHYRVQYELGKGTHHTGHAGQTLPRVKETF